MNNKYKLQNQSLNLLKFIANLVLCMCVFFYSSFVCISEYANVYFKTTITKPNIKIILTAGVPSSQALPGFLITAPPSVCESAVLGAVAVWIQNRNKIKVATWRRAQGTQICANCFIDWGRLSSQQYFGRRIKIQLGLWQLWCQLGEGDWIRCRQGFAQVRVFGWRRNTLRVIWRRAHYASKILGWQKSSCSPRACIAIPYTRCWRSLLSLHRQEAE